jgi:signal transduction histidine kinase
MRARHKAAVAAIVFTVLVLAAFNVGWWWYYSSITSYLERQLSHRLISVAATAALHVSPDDVDALMIEDLDVYAEQLLYLDSIARIDSLSEASIIDLDFNYLVSNRSEISQGGYLLAQLNFDTLSRAIGGRPVASELYDVDGTYLKSAYAPLPGADGTVQAILVAEAGAEYFDLLGSLRTNLFALAGGSAAAVVVLLVILILYNRRMAAAEEKLFQAGSQAALGRMVAVVSHEVKNPMMIIRAAGERLQKKYDDPEASFVVEEVERLDSIVSGYLSFAKGDAALHRQKVDLTEMTRKIVGQFTERFDQEGVGLIDRSGDDAMVTLADPVGLRQVLINLLMNGLQAVTSSSSEGRDKSVWVDLKRVNGRILLRVTDSGPGIKSSHRDKLFEPFYTTKTQGSGLGLYLCKRIVEQHEGSIRVVDKEKGKTTFEVVLPEGENS